MCGESKPIRNDVMLDPNQQMELIAMPAGLAYMPPSSGKVHAPPPSLDQKTGDMPIKRL
jgi:hypothetical protein